MHRLFQASDNPRNFIRMLLIDFSKAFDRIDENVMMQKFVANGNPLHFV